MSTDTLAEVATSEDLRRRTFRSDIFDIHTMVERMEKIAKRAQAKGLEGGWTWEITSDTTKDEHGRLIQVEVLSIQGERVKANGWTLVADVTWEGDQPIVGTVPGYDGPMVDRATLDGHCDICNTVRERSHVIVCEHPQEGRKVVGGQCVRDLLGHDFSMAFWPSLDDIEESWGSSGPRGPLAFATLDIIATAVVATRVWGWVSKAQADANWSASTASIATALLVRGPADMIKAQKKVRGGVDWEEIERIEKAAALLEDPQVREEAQAALTWAQGLDPEASEFNANLTTLAGLEFVSSNRVGILAFVPTGYTRHLGREAEKAAKAAKAPVNNEALGQPKDKIEFTGTITGIKFIEGDYGTTTLVKFLTTTNQKAAWFASNTAIDETWIGTQVQVKATVKGTSEFNGETETRILRAKVTKA